ncbi:MAG: MazG family protein, partial [Candidatus Aureabacteria bacterium]|nr:MazG family protein [Candidatus Auribacterota bacterium]
IKTSEEAFHQWENIKSEESKHQNRKSAVDGIPRKLPALQKAVKIQKKAAKAGFDWENIDGVVEKIEEELRELKTEIKADNKNNITEELGDFLFSVVNLSRFIDTEPEYALHKTIKKFENRFRKMEKIIKESGKKMQDMPLKELDNYWEMVKK